MALLLSLLMDDDQSLILGAVKTTQAVGNLDRPHLNHSWLSKTDDIYSSIFREY